MTDLSMTQASQMRQLRQAGPGWHSCHYVATPTVEALEKRGLVEVTRLHTAHFSKERHWREIDPEELVEGRATARPAPSFEHQVAEKMANIWGLLGLGTYSRGTKAPPSAIQLQLGLTGLRDLEKLLELTEGAG